MEWKGEYGPEPASGSDQGGKYFWLSLKKMIVILTNNLSFFEEASFSSRKGGLEN